MSTEKARWAKLADLPKITDKQQLDENFIGHQMVGNIFDREKEKYEDAFEHFLSEMYEKEENLDEKLATQKQLDLSSLKSSILRVIPNFENKEELKNHLENLVKDIEDDLFNKEK
jgi:sulfur relay (sulfurtransferase) DsrC/TusE family protein